LEFDGVSVSEEKWKWPCCSEEFIYKLKPGHLRESVDDLLKESGIYLVQDHSAGCKQDQFHEE